MNNNSNDKIRNQQQLRYNLSTLELKTLQFVIKSCNNRMNFYIKADSPKVAKEIGTDERYARRLILKLVKRGALVRRGHKIQVKFEAAKHSITTSRKTGNFTTHLAPKLPVSKSMYIYHVNKSIYNNKNQSFGNKNRKTPPPGSTDFNFFLKNNWDIANNYISAVTDTSKIRNLPAYITTVLKKWKNDPNEKNKALSKMTELKVIAEKQEKKKLITINYLEGQQEARKYNNSRKEQIEFLKQSGFYQKNINLARKVLAFEMKVAESQIRPMMLDSKILEYYAQGNIV